jgi:hypothetical protein
VIRNLIGFREAGSDLSDRDEPGSDARDRRDFILAPALPPSLFEIGRTYGITNLRFRDCVLDAHFTVEGEGRLGVRLNCVLDGGGQLQVRDQGGQVIAQAGGSGRVRELTFQCENGATHEVSWQAS